MRSAVGAAIVVVLGLFLLFAWMAQRNHPQPAAVATLGVVGSTKVSQAGAIAGTAVAPDATPTTTPTPLPVVTPSGVTPPAPPVVITATPPSGSNATVIAQATAAALLPTVIAQATQAAQATATAQPPTSTVTATATPTATAIPPTMVSPPAVAPTATATSTPAPPAPPVVAKPVPCAYRAGATILLVSRDGVRAGCVQNFGKTGDKPTDPGRTYFLNLRPRTITEAEPSQVAEIALSGLPAGRDISIVVGAAYPGQCGDAFRVHAGQPTPSGLQGAEIGGSDSPPHNLDPVNQTWVVEYRMMIPASQISGGQVTLFFYNTTPLVSCGDTAGIGYIKFP